MIYIFLCRFEGQDRPNNNTLPIKMRFFKTNALLMAK